MLAIIGSAGSGLFFVVLTVNIDELPLFGAFFLELIWHERSFSFRITLALNFFCISKGQSSYLVSLSFLSVVEIQIMRADLSCGPSLMSCLKVKEFILLVKNNFNTYLNKLHFTIFLIHFKELKTQSSAKITF